MTHDDRPADTEVQPKAKRRTFSAAYKHRILAEADQCQRGELGALLRREGLYHSHLSKWRAERQADQLTDRKRGPTANPQRAEAKRLRAENERLKRKLADAEAIIDAQKKLAALLDRLNAEDPK
jgi:transposase-like protein